MMDFRKGLLAIAVAGLGLVGTASAQVTNSGAANLAFCNGLAVGDNCGVANYASALAALRAEGGTEQLPAAVLTGFGGTVNTSSVTFLVTTSAPISNVILTGSTTSQTDATAQFIAWPGNASTAVAGVLVNSTTLSFTLPIPAVNLGGSAVGASVVIENIRVNVSALTAGSTVTVVPSGTATGGIVFTAASTAFAEGITQTSLAKAKFSGYGNIALCAVGVKDVNAVGVITVGGAYAGAFSTDAIEQAKETVAVLPYALAAPAGTTNPTTVANATVGYTVSLTFSGLASGVNYYLPVVVTNGTFSLTLVASPSTAVGTPLSAVTIGGAGNAGNTNNAAATGASVTGVALFQPTGGSFTAYYRVSATAGVAGIDTTASFGTAVAGPGYFVQTATGTYTGITLFENVPVLASAGAAIAAPSVVAVVAGNTAPLYAQFTPPATTAVTATASTTASTLTPGDPNATGTGQLSSCSTTILFPYLIQGLYGYSTGIDIANASLGTTVSGNTVTSSSGTCTLKLYGTVNGTALATPITLGPGQITVAGSDPMTIAAGATGLFSLGSVPNGTATLTGYLGYGVASCNFQQGHAFALTTDGIGDSNGYLGVVLSDVFNNGVVAQNDAQ